MNSSIKDLSLYPLSLATYLNSCIYSSIILLSCSTYFDFVIFFDLSSPLLNFFFISFKISSTISNSHISISKSSNIFSFQISAAPSCIYGNTQCIYSSTINNLHTVTNPNTFSTFLLNVYSITTSILNPVLYLEISAVSTSFLMFMSYTSPPVRKQRTCSETISELYKPTFHGGHFSYNMSNGGAATLWIFHLPWWRYSYST